MLRSPNELPRTGHRHHRLQGGRLRRGRPTAGLGLSRVSAAVAPARLGGSRFGAGLPRLLRRDPRGGGGQPAAIRFAGWESPARARPLRPSARPAGSWATAWSRPTPGRSSIVASFSREFGARRLYELHGPHAAPDVHALQAPLAAAAPARGVCGRPTVPLLRRPVPRSSLGLEPAISWPLAGRTMLFNVRTHQWDEEILAAIDLEPARLARPVPSGSVVGTIPHKVAARVGPAATA